MSRRGLQLLGRDIDHLSNYGTQTNVKYAEKEVLFLPHSFFLCWKKEIGPVPTEPGIPRKLHIHLIQIEVGFSGKTVLWVDDQILNPKWENRRLMEKTSARNYGTKFIPKESTALAAAFLKSTFGDMLRSNNVDDFRIVTDMSRPPDPKAGAKFAKIVRDLGFKNKILVYTSSTTTGEKYVRDEFGLPQGSPLPDGISVTQLRDKCYQFLTWEEERFFPDKL